MAHNLTLAQRYAWHLAKTLMACVILFRSDDGYAVVTADEYDLGAERVIHEYDPFA